MKAKHQVRIRDAGQDRLPEIQSSLVSEDFQRMMGQTDNDCRFQIPMRLKISDPHFDKVCTCSKFPSEAVLWIKEVEMVESVDDLKPSCSI